MQDKYSEELVSAVTELDYGRVVHLVDAAIQKGLPPREIIQSMQQGIIAVGKKYEECEYFLSELMAAGEIMKIGLKKLTSRLSNTNVASIGTVLIGTIQGDIHDIGKNLVKTLLQANGFRVVDLGVDVPAEEFVSEIQAVNPDILALSALLTTTMEQMRNVIWYVENAGLRKSIKVIIGGNAITEEFGREIGADAAVKDALKGVNICKEWVSITH